MARKSWVWRMGLAALAVVSGTGLIIACAGEIYDSVHFNGARPDFGEPPSPMIITSWGEEPSRPVPNSTGWEYEEYDEKKEKEREERIARLRGQVDRAISSEQFGTAKPALEALLKEDIEDREIMRDRLQVLVENEKTRLPVSLLNSYFTARASEKGDNGLIAIANNPQAGFLQAFAEYGLAAARYDAGNTTEAAKRYEAVAEKFPNSVKREEALIMAVRTRLSGTEDDAGRIKIAPADVEKGLAASKKLKADYPASRFLASAAGYETRAMFLQGKAGEAYIQYLEVLAKAQGHEARSLALSSLRIVKNKLTAAEADKVRNGLFAKPELLMPYLEFRLYHSGEQLQKDLAGLATLTKEVLAKSPDVTISGAIRSRLAEIAYLQGDYKTAQTWATEVVDSKAVNDNQKALATYVLASATTKLGQSDKAVELYERVIKNHKDSYLVGAARENLAIIYEKAKKPGLALDQYRALKYYFDVATLLDVRMTTAEIEAYIAERQNDPEIDKLKLAVGLRYLRKDNLDAAEKWLKQIPDTQRKEISEAGSRNYNWFIDESDTGPFDRLQDPLETVQAIRALNQQVSSAANADAKAEAQYALASYWYERRNLLLYNASLWRGGRSVLAGFWDAGVDKAGYDKAILEHHYEHECLYKARKIAVLLAKENPKSPFAAKALYRAACAARRLADFNSYWRDPKLSNPMWNESISLMKRVAAEYPNDPLAASATKYAKAFDDERKGLANQAMFRD